MKLHRLRRKPRFSFAFGLASLLIAQVAGAWPDLKVVKTGPAQAAPGDLISYTLTYSNSGPVNGVNVVLKDFLPAYTTVLTNTLGSGTLSGSTISWSLGTVASRAGGSRSFQVRVNTNTPSGLYITNRAQIFGTEAEEPGKTNDNYSTLITKIAGPPPDFCRAILAKQPISLHGTMVIDSFNSRDPNFSTNGRYDPNKRGDGGHVASISDSLTVTTDTGNTKVYGRFETGPSGTVRITGNASVGSLAWVDGGNRSIEPGWYLTNLNVVIPDAILPALTFTTLPKNAGTVSGTNYTYILNSGNYSRSTDLSFSSSENMVINGNVVLYFQKKLTITGSAYIYITPGSKLTVYLAGITSLAGGVTINGTGFATNCAYVGLPSCTSISFSGNSEYIGTVYAPQATVQMSGGGAQAVNFIGSVIANTVNVTGNYQFHYDQNLCVECLPPTVLSAPVSLTNCPGTPASFSVSARGTGLHYAWFKENVALTAQTNSTLTLPDVSAGDAGTYRVVVSVPCGDAVTNSATLTVNAPVGATALVSFTAIKGGNATFSTVASGTGPFSYVWKKNDSIIPGQTGNSLVLSNINRGAAGTYSVEVSGACGSVARIATLTVLNSAPAALNDSYTTPEDTTLNVNAPGVLANDSDPDGDVLKAILVTGPTHGTLTLNTNGGFSYTPANHYVGGDSFTYEANDGADNSGIATASITVTPVNDSPVAVNDNYTIPEHTTLNVTAPGVLGNDSDPDGDALKTILVTGPLHGTLTLNINGSFSYTPTNNYVGGDSFTYKANDGLADSGVATVSITITPVNDPPVAVNDAYTTPENIALNISAPGVLTNDTDVDGDALSAILASTPAHGTLTLSTNGSFTYIPTNHYNGPDSFTYRAFDGTTNSANIAIVNITVTPVNDPPEANTDNYTALEDTVLTIAAPGVLGNDTDADGDTLTARLDAAPLHGTVTLNQNGSFTYSSTADYYGPDSFTYFASDGQPPVRLATVNITVEPVNDPPSFLKGADQLVQQNAGPQIVPGWATAISPGPTNESSQTVTFQLFSDSDALFAVSPAIGTNGTLTYTPASNAYGVADVRVIAHDDGGTANGGVDNSPPQTFRITVNAPPTVSIASPTNGAQFIAPANFTVLADAHDVDGTITKVEIFEGTNRLTELTNGEPYFIVRTNVQPGAYTFSAIATDNLDARGTSAPVTITVLERPPLTVLSALHYNPQTDFFEERVRVTNPTYSTFDAVRVSVFNLTNFPPITVHNPTGFTNGIPFIQTYSAVPPNSYVDMTIEYYSPLRIKPNPILRPELVSPRLPDVGKVPGIAQRINRGLMLANQTFMVEFATLANRVYVVQYSSDLQTWKSSEPAIISEAGWAQWIDNGLPKTDSPPATQSMRFYRVVLLP